MKLRRAAIRAAMVIGSACVLVSSSQAQISLVEQRVVTDAAADPALDSVCHLHIKRKFLFFSAGEYTGTGVLFEGRYILTAGHNVYQDRSRIASITIRCGTAEPMSAPVAEVIRGRQGLDASGFPEGGFPRDFGVIRLSRTINVRAPFELAEKEPDPGTSVHFAGFPGEGDRASAPSRDGWHLHRAEGVATGIAGSIISYNVRTFKSNSGGPVWLETEGKPVLLGIHVRPSGGRIVDAEFIAEVRRLIAALDQQAEADRR